MGIGDWGLGIGDWGLGIGDWAQSPIPGSLWAMPCLEQVNELKDKCTSEWTTENGVNGRRFIGHNGASVFFPAAGCLWDND